MTLEADYQTVRSFLCRVSSATASNAAVDSDTAAFSVLPALGENQIVVESITNTASAEIENINLNNGDYLFESPDSTTLPDTLYSFYAPNNDIEVEMDLYGGKGADGPDTNNADGQSGGEGGYSRIKFTMEKNQEYVIAGLTNDIQAPFLYKKGVLMAVVGGGGQGGADNRLGWNHGGVGGGVGIAGADSQIGGGSGGGVIELNPNGIFGSIMRDNAGNPIVTPYADDSVALGAHGTDAGVTISCTKGQYWAQQGKGACEDLGSVKFRLGDGTEVVNTSSSITRGFKAGYNIMQTAGKGKSSALAGDGGNGAMGGEGGWNDNGGGGGGSGYTEGSVTVVSTMQGGSTGNAKVVLRVAT